MADKVGAFAGKCKQVVQVGHGHHGDAGFLGDGLRRRTARRGRARFTQHFLAVERDDDPGRGAATGACWSSTT